MSAPNLLGIGTITGRSTASTLNSTSATTLVSNAASSGKVLKINSINIANYDASNTADISVYYNTAAAGAGTNYKVAGTITVAAKTSLVVVDKATSIYLEEDTSVVVQASAANRLDVLCSYEEIS